MVLTVSVALLAVVSIGVSTFAWFQANANVNIETTSDSTTITVSKPEDFSFYAYKGNHNASHTAGATETTEDENFTFEDDFVAVTTPLQTEAETVFDGSFVPGTKKVFALQYSNHTSGDDIYLEATSLVSQTIKKVNSNKSRKVYKDAGAYTEADEINVGWAISAYSMIVDSDVAPDPEDYASFVNSPSGNDYISLTKGSNVIGLSDEDSVSIDNSPASANYCKASGSIDLYRDSGEENEITAGFVFYAIVFSDGILDRYQEVDAEGEDNLAGNTDANTRYFVKNDAGNADKTNPVKYTSNCFAGLKFHISALSFKF